LITQQNILKSTKKFGRYERPLIKILTRFFRRGGYQVIPHARFNLAWGAIISDIDLLLIKDNKLTAIEVKSHKDSVKKAKRQLEAIYGYVDFTYLAVERLPKQFELDHAGLILIKGNKAEIIRQPKFIASAPTVDDIAGIQKKCLLRFLDAENTRHAQRTRKLALASLVHDSTYFTNLKTCVQEILTCGQHCQTQCPIWHFHDSSRSN
jgi:hypothetical protein